MQQARVNLSHLVLNALKRTAELAAAFAKVTTLYRSRTGALRSSIKHSAVAFHGRTSANAKHAVYVEEGTRPHEIRARRKKVLRFVQNGTVRFTPRVFHPGTKARPFMQQARDRAEPIFDRLCKEAVDRMFE